MNVKRYLCNYISIHIILAKCQILSSTSDKIFDKIHDFNLFSFPLLPSFIYIFYILDVLTIEFDILSYSFNTTLETAERYEEIMMAPD